MALFTLCFIIGDCVAVGQPNTVRESGQQGQSTTALAWLYLPRSASQDECELCLCSYEEIFNMKNKRQLFSLLMSGQGESHSEKVDICAYSSNSSRMGSCPPSTTTTKLVTIIWEHNRFQKNGFKKMWNTHTHTSVTDCFVRVKDKMQSILLPYEPIFDVIFMFQLQFIQPAHAQQINSVNTESAFT